VPCERDGLFDIVSWVTANGSGTSRNAACAPVLILRSARAAAAPQIRAGVRASRRMRTATAWPACFETHRSASSLWNHLCSLGAAMLLSMRASMAGGISAKRSQAGRIPVSGLRDGRTCGCRKRPPGELHCFRIVIYNERRNFNVLSHRRAVRRSPASCSVAHVFFSVVYRGAGERRSATSVAGRAFRARGAVTACRLNRSRGQP
jgi:hypothetical protein